MSASHPLGEGLGLVRCLLDDRRELQKLPEREQRAVRRVRGVRVEPALRLLEHQREPLSPHLRAAPMIIYI